MQRPGDTRSFAVLVIRRVVDAVNNQHLFKVERADSLKTCSVYAVFILVRTAQVMSVDAATRAEIVLRRVGIESVSRQRVGTFEKLEVFTICSNGDCATHTAK